MPGYLQLYSNSKENNMVDDPFQLLLGFGLFVFCCFCCCWGFFFKSLLNIFF